MNRSFKRLSLTQVAADQLERQIEQYRDRRYFNLNPSHVVSWCYLKFMELHFDKHRAEFELEHLRHTNRVRDMLTGIDWSNAEQVKKLKGAVDEAARAPAGPQRHKRRLTRTGNGPISIQNGSSRTVESAPASRDSKEDEKGPPISGGSGAHLRNAPK